MPADPPRGSRVCIYGETLLCSAPCVCHRMGGVGCRRCRRWVCARAVALVVLASLGRLGNWVRHIVCGVLQLVSGGVLLWVAGR